MVAAFISMCHFVLPLPCSLPEKNNCYFTATNGCDILINIDGRKTKELDAKGVLRAKYRKKCQNNIAHELINPGT